MKRIALLVLLALAFPALALAGSGPPDLGRRIVHRVAFECRLFEVRPGKAAEVPDGLPFAAERRAGFKRGTIAADDLRTFFDGSFETLEGVTLAWSGALAATQISPARATVPLPGPAAPDRTLELVLSASYLSYFDAGGPSARFGVGFAFRTAGTEDEAPAAVPPSVHDWVPSGAGFGAVLRESSGPDDPELLLVIGNWRHDGHVIVPARAAALPAADEPHAESASDPATNAPAATLARADVDASVLAKLDRIIVPEFEFKDADICDVVSRLGDCSREFDDETVASERGETFERWRFTILPDIGGRYDLIGEWMDFFGQLGVSWPPGTYAERSGDDGLVVRNTPENLNLIRMIFGALSVNVLRGDPVVLEDAPATPSPAVDAHGLDAVHPEIRIDALVLQIGSPTNRESATDWYYRVLLGADPALFPEADRHAVACYRGTLDAARAAAVSDGNAHILGMPRVVFRDRCKAEVSLLDIDGEPGKPAVTNGVRLSVRPIVCRGGTPLLRLTAEASVFAGDDTAETEELGLALEPGAAAVFAPPPAGDCRVLVLLFPDDSWSHAADPATNAP
ncbi:MAG: hypothetical protein IJL06_04410, partial [Kiritimatiellae bacterium]|nr:hypothetical protein [Kiritimatiellia bacterium]